MVATDVSRVSIFFGVCTQMLHDVRSAAEGFFGHFTLVWLLSGVCPGRCHQV